MVFRNFTRKCTCLAAISRCSTRYILEVNYMKNPARLQGKCFTFHRWLIKVSLVHHRHPSCFRHSIFLSSESLGRSESVFSRLHFPKSFPKTSCRHLMNISKDASPRGAHRIRRRSLTFALSWVRLSCTMAPRISRSPRVILTKKQDEGRR